MAKQQDDTSTLSHACDQLFSQIIAAHDNPLVIKQLLEGTELALWQHLVRNKLIDTISTDQRTACIIMLSSCASIERYSCFTDELTNKRLNNVQLTEIVTNFIQGDTQLEEQGEAREQAVAARGRSLAEIAFQRNGEGDNQIIHRFLKMANNVQWKLFIRDKLQPYTETDRTYVFCAIIASACENLERRNFLHEFFLNEFESSLNPQVQNAAAAAAVPMQGDQAQRRQKSCEIM